MSVDESPMSLPVVTLTPAGVPQPTTVAATNALDTTRTLHRWYRSRDSHALLAVMVCISVLDRTQFPKMRTVIRDENGRDQVTTDPRALCDFLLGDYVELLDAWAVDPDPDAAIPRISDSFRTSFIAAGKADEVDLPASRAFFTGIDEETLPALHQFGAESVALSEVFAHAQVAVADADLCAVLAGATPSMDDLPLQPYDPLFDTGVLYLAQPLAFHGTHVHTLDGREPHLIAVAWQANTVRDDQAGVTFYPVIRVPGRPLRPGEPALMSILPGFHWAYGASAADSYGRYIQQPWYQSSRSNHGPLHDPIAERLTLAFWHLSRQRLTNTSTATPTKPARKRAARARLKAANADGIVMISLRHHAASGHDRDDTTETATQRAWRSRWMVRGHWRNQYYPSIKGHRPVYIHPYLKGPDDAPVSGAQRVWVGHGTGLTA